MKASRPFITVANALRAKARGEPSPTTGELAAAPRTSLPRLQVEVSTVVVAGRRSADREPSRMPLPATAPKPVLRVARVEDLPCR